MRGTQPGSPESDLSSATLQSQQHDISRPLCLPGLTHLLTRLHRGPFMFWSRNYAGGCRYPVGDTASVRYCGECSEMVVCVQTEWQGSSSNLHNVCWGPAWQADRYPVKFLPGDVHRRAMNEGLKASFLQISYFWTWQLHCACLHLELLTFSNGVWLAPAFPVWFQHNPWPSTYVSALSSSHLDLPGQLRASQHKHCETILDEDRAQDTIFLWNTALKISTTQVRPLAYTFNWKMLPGKKVSLTEFDSVSWALEYTVVRPKMSAVGLLAGKLIFTRRWESNYWLSSSVQDTEWCKELGVRRTWGSVPAQPLSCRT